jgi:hypothetical protein
VGQENKEVEVTRHTPKKRRDGDELEPGTVMPFRRNLDGVILYTCQVWKPSFGDGEVLRDAGFKPYDGGNEALENTMLWYTIDPEAAFKLATPEQWDETPMFQQEHGEVIDRPEGMTGDEWAEYAENLMREDGE